jgi:glycerol-3-phosphate dehydrogenase
MCLPNGGSNLYPALKDLFLSYQSWDEERWQQEVNRYETIWTKYYSLPSNA